MANDEPEVEPAREEEEEAQEEEEQEAQEEEEAAEQEEEEDSEAQESEHEPDIIVEHTDENVKNLIEASLAEARRFEAIRDFARAARALSQACQVASLDANKLLLSDLYLQRAAVWTHQVTYLRSRPSALSERAALYDRDPYDLAEMALSDVKKARDSLAAHHEETKVLPGDHALQLQVRMAAQEGRSLFQLERFEEARAVLLEGLAIDPTADEVAKALAEVKEVLDGSMAVGGEVQGEPAEGGGGAGAGAGAGGAIAAPGRPSEGGDGTATSPGVIGSPPGRGGSFKLKRKALERTDDADCILCSKLLFRPVTTPCGHSYCLACFQRSQDHSSRCPMCRTVLHVGKTLPVTLALHNLLQNSYPEEYAERRREEETLASPVTGESMLPLFVMSCMLPNQKQQLNIFEPRYRLLIRRVMAGNRRFGMACAFAGEQGHALCPIAVECEILDCQPQPDGRFYLEIVGRRRVRLSDIGEQDGYRIARPTEIKDEPIPADAVERVTALAAEVDRLANTWIDSLRAMAPGGRAMRLAELLADIGTKPAATNLEALSFYHSLLMFPDAPLKLKLMEMTSTEERFRELKELLQPGRRRDNVECSIM